MTSPFKRTINGVNYGPIDKHLTQVGDKWFLRMYVNDNRRVFCFDSREAAIAFRNAKQKDPNCGWQNI